MENTVNLLLLQNNLYIYKFRARKISPNWGGFISEFELYYNTLSGTSLFDE